MSFQLRLFFSLKQSKPFLSGFLPLYFYNFFFFSRKQITEDDKAMETSVDLLMMLISVQHISMTNISTVD